MNLLRSIVKSTWFCGLVNPIIWIEGKLCFFLRTSCNSGREKGQRKETFRKCDYVRQRKDLSVESRRESSSSPWHHYFGDNQSVHIVQISILSMLCAFVSNGNRIRLMIIRWSLVCRSLWLNIIGSQVFPFSLLFPECRLMKDQMKHFSCVSISEAPPRRPTHFHQEKAVVSLLGGLEL